MTMKKIISLEKKKIRLSFRLHLALTLLVGGMLALVMTQAPSAQAQKYSDWSAPVNLGPVINSAFNDLQPAISNDGLSLYFTSNRPGSVGGFDMYVSQRASVHDPWGSPVNLGPTVNTTSNEGSPAFSRDGHLMFFESDRPGGLGGRDIWVSRRVNKHDDFGWQTPVNLGPGVNSAADDSGPSYFENDENGEHDEDGDNDEEGAPQLYFASTRTPGLGGLDIYISEQTASGCFGPAVLVTELSSPGGDAHPSIRHDGLEIFFHSTRVGSIGVQDLWVATRESTHDAWSTPVNLGVTINTAFAEQQPYLSSDAKTLFFGSDRPGGSGGLDLYMSTRTKLRGHGDDDDRDRDNR
jgi:Tol biopolymer transport system component